MALVDAVLPDAGGKWGDGGSGEGLHYGIPPKGAQSLSPASSSLGRGLVEHHAPLLRRPPSPVDVSKDAPARPTILDASLIARSN